MTPTSDVVARLDDAATDYVRRYVSLMAVGVEFRAASVLSAVGDRFPKKEVYNALTYMTRAGQLTRLGYGRYEVARQVTDWEFRALTAERLLAEARAGLTQIASGRDKDGNALDFFQDIAGEVLASIGGGNG
jgi:hypothetical protein